MRRSVMAIAAIVAIAGVGAGSAWAQAPSCAVSSPTESEVIDCLDSIGFTSTCSVATADFIASELAGDLGQFAGCADRGDCFDLAVDAVGGVCIGGGGGTGVGGVGTSGDVAQETAARVFTGQVLETVVPTMIAPGGTGTTGDGTLAAGSDEQGSRSGAAASYRTIDATAALDLWEAGTLEGKSYEVAFGFGSTSGGGTFFLDGDYSRVDPDVGDGLNVFHGRVGYKGELGDTVLLGLYGTAQYLDIDSESILGGGGGLFGGLRFPLGPIRLSLGAVGQGIVTDVDLPDDDLDYTVSATYGGGLGVPIGDFLALNGQVYRITAFKQGRDDELLDDVGSFTTLAASVDLALSPSFVLNGGYRTRFEIDDYDTHAFLIGMRAFLD